MLQQVLLSCSAGIQEVGCKPHCGRLYHSCLFMVVFVVAHCCNMHNSVPHGATAANALIFSSAVVQEGGPEE